mmetsp:Transcript_71327/g.201045  ORF Transcript_71327/g.201045 Transcript_71327/m.201045 type:complete len:644 (-) Transcript_71327:1711-3642(-)
MQVWRESGPLEGLGYSQPLPKFARRKSFNERYPSFMNTVYSLGVNCIPGFQGVIQDEDDACKVAREVGYPVMIKASAGGGGKGMRIAWNDEEAKEGYRLSTEEAIMSFGDDRLFIEKFIEEPHHIEIQLLADHDGKVVCFPERECSVQRRNQKVLEESPSALLTPEVRSEMCRQAAMLATAVNYRSAGTVEFLADKHGNFYFLEMNTRLQVEHPVTEYVSGVDLVEHMLKIAGKQPLPADLTTESIAKNIKGWALEARVYAEDPFRGFLPSTGSLLDYREPEGCTAFNLESNVRVDSGVREGTEISTYYDPMISKLVTHGATRDECIDRMSDALNRYVILGTAGFAHNASFLADLCRHPRFRRAETPTSFIEEEYPDGFQGVQLDEQETLHAVATAAMIQATRAEREVMQVGASSDGYNSAPEASLFDAGAGGGDEWVVVQGLPGNDEAGEPNGTAYHTRIVDEDGGLVVEVRAMAADAGAVAARVRVGDYSWQLEQPLLEVEMDGVARVVQYHTPSGTGGGTRACGFNLGLCGAVLPMNVLTPKEHELYQHMLAPEVVDTANFVHSPMPGVLVSLSVEPGQHIENGQEICVMEAMKMQNVLRSPRAGIVAECHAVAGQKLDVDQLIVSLVSEEADLNEELAA